MKHFPIAVGACLTALAIGTLPASAQGSMTPSNADSTYRAAQQAGASAQKVAPPNLVLPADMGGGTWSQRYGNSSNPTSPNTQSGTGTMSPNGTTGTNTNTNINTGTGTNTGTGSSMGTNSNSTTNGTSTNGTNNTTSPNGTNTNTNPTTTPNGANTNGGAGGGGTK